MEDLTRMRPGRSLCARSSTRRVAGFAAGARAARDDAVRAHLLPGMRSVSPGGEGRVRERVPRCSMPLRAKDLAPNHAQANVVAAIDALRALPVDASVREGDASLSESTRASPVSRTSWATPTTTTSTTTDISRRARPPRPRRLRRRRPPSSAVASSPSGADRHLCRVHPPISSAQAENAAAKASAAASAAEAAANAAASAAAGAAAGVRRGDCGGRGRALLRPVAPAESQPGPSPQTQTQTQPPTRPAA